MQVDAFLRNIFPGQKVTKAKRNSALPDTGENSPGGYALLAYPIPAKPEIASTEMKVHIQQALNTAIEKKFLVKK
ncbi:MAG: hypothetical protein SGI96_01255 [Bacteroidota bacterium]|nr:hypothetical protein [Bacteroidota bacterium]